MSTLIPHRLFFLVVMLFTLWVGFFGFFRPHEILRALPWPVPPLHCRFIGALYLSATLFLGLSMFARRWLHMRTIVYIALAWTGWLLLVTFIHWNTFDFARRQVWFWLVAYVAFPIVAAIFAWAGDDAEVPHTERIDSRWIPLFFAATGALLVVLAALLFVAPGWVATLWPWKISTFLAQVYSGPVLGYGVGLLMLAGRRNWPESLIPVAGLLAFALLALLGSSWHLELFTRGSLSMNLWFGVLAALAAASALVLGQAALRK